MNRRSPATLNAHPLLRLVRNEQINLDEHDNRTKRAFYRACQTGKITPRTADMLAIRLLNMHPCEIWGLDTWTPQ